MRRLLIVVVAATLALGLLAVTATAGEAPPRLEGEWVVLEHSDFDAGTSDLVIVRPDGTDLANLTNGAAEDLAGELSPDGTAIAFTSRVEGFPTLWLMDVDGTNRRQLLDRYAQHPTWTPDGRSIVYAGTNDIRIVQRDGQDDRPLVVEARSPSNPSVSPDGATVVFDMIIDDTNARRLFTAPIGGGEATPIADDSAFEPGWSPDGSRILFTTFRADAEDNIWATNPDGTEPEPLVPSDFNDFHATWSPDGSRVMFESVRGDIVDIAVYDRVDGTTVTILSAPLGEDSPTYRRPTWTAVTLEAIVMAPPTTTTSTAATTTTTTVAATTTTVAEVVDDGSRAGDSTDWLVIGIVGAIVALTAFGLGVLVGGRLQTDTPPPPPPPEEDDAALEV